MGLESTRPTAESLLCHLLTVTVARSLSVDPFHSHKEEAMISDLQHAEMRHEVQKHQTHGDTIGDRQTSFLTPSPVPAYICLTVGRWLTLLSLSYPI